MNVQPVLSSKSLVDCINNRVLTPQQLLTISRRLMVVSDQSPSDLTSTTAMDEVSYCRECLDRARKTSNCPQINNLETFMCVLNRNFHSRPN